MILHMELIDTEIVKIVYDKINDELSIPLKHQGLITIYNGLDVDQT